MQVNDTGRKYPFKTKNGLEGIPLNDWVTLPDVKVVTDPQLTQSITSILSTLETVAYVATGFAALFIISKITGAK